MRITSLLLPCPRRARASFRPSTRLPPATRGTLPGCRQSFPAPAAQHTLEQLANQWFEDKIKSGKPAPRTHTSENRANQRLERQRMCKSSANNRLIHTKMGTSDWHCVKLTKVGTRPFSVQNTNYKYNTHPMSLPNVMRSSTGKRFQWNKYSSERYFYYRID